MVSEKTIPPGGEGSIKVTLNTSRKRGMTSKTIRVTTNDPDEAEVVLKISCDIEVELEVKPVSAYFRKLKKQESATKELEIIGKNIENLRILEIKSTNPKITGELRKDEKQSTLYFDVTIHPGMDIGRFNEKLTLKTNNQAKPELEISVRGEITGNISVEPPRIFFRSFFGDSALSRNVSISRPEITGFKVISVKGLEDIAKVVLEQLEKDTFNVTITLKPELSTGPINGTLSIETNDPEQPSVEIPVRGFKRDKNPSGDSTNEDPLLFFEDGAKIEGQEGIEELKFDK